MQTTGKKRLTSCSTWKDKNPLHPGANSLRCLRLLVFLLATCQATHSAQVYKWVDKDGNTHYGDKPLGDNTEAVSIRKAPGVDDNHEQRTSKQRRLLEVLQEERQEKAQKKLELAEEKRQRQAECDKARKRRLEIARATFLYKKSDDPNNPIVYSDEERLAATAKVEASIKKWCD